MFSHCSTMHASTELHWSRRWQRLLPLHHLLAAILGSALAILGPEMLGNVKNAGPGQGVGGAHSHFHNCPQSNQPLLDSSRYQISAGSAGDPQVRTGAANITDFTFPLYPPKHHHHHHHQRAVICAVIAAAIPTWIAIMPSFVERNESGFVPHLV